jgi:hypothetical protein
MEYLTSRSFRIPEDMMCDPDRFWFNLWQNKLWPYERLQDGDVLYWYETPTRRIVWKTIVEKVRTFTYQSRSEAFDTLRKEFGSFDENQPYLKEKPNKGYCLAFKVHSPQKLDLPKPAGVNFPREGWLRAKDPRAREWVGSTSQKASGA